MNGLWIIGLVFTLARKTKSILFASNHKIKKVPKLNITYKNDHILRLRIRWNNVRSDNGSESN